MNATRWLSSLFRSFSSRPGRKLTTTIRSQKTKTGQSYVFAEQLEERTLLTVFSVNTVMDSVDVNPGDGFAQDASGKTSLRAAVMESNALAGDDTIQVPAGTYTLSLDGRGEDSGATGDLDVNDTTGSLTIIGTGVVSIRSTVDRMFDVRQGADLTLDHLELSGAREMSRSSGGAIRNDGTLEVNVSRIEDNQAEAGGGIDNSGQLTITDSVLTDNHSRLSFIGGGSIQNQPTGTTTIVRSEVSHSTAQLGAGIYENGGTLTVVDSTIHDNTSPGNAGAGIYSRGNVTVTGSTVRDNDGYASGGGIYANGPLTVTNSTFSGNQTANGVGGAIYAVGDADISNTTIVNNSALRAGGGFYQGSSGSTVTFTSTIIAGNVDLNGSDAFGDNPDLRGFVLTSGGNNIFGVLNTAGGLADSVNDDQAGSLATPLDAGLDVLADSGGLTWTHAILPGSPALDNGSNPLSLTTDQRGEGRTRGPETDVGAFEFDVVPPAEFIVNTIIDSVDVHPGDGFALDASGNTSLRAAVMESNALAGDDTIQVPAGTYTLYLSGRGEDSGVTGDLDVNDTTGSLTIIGTGVVSIRSTVDRMFDVRQGADLTLDHLELSGAREMSRSSGGAIRNDGTLEVYDSRIEDNQAEAGGGIDNSGQLTITDSVLTDNHSRLSFIGGGSIQNQPTGTTTIVRSEVSHSTAQIGAGVYENGGTLTVIDSTIHNNTSPGNSGGGIYSRGNVTITGSTVRDNDGYAGGGGINATGPLTVTNSTFSGNQTANGVGGAIRASGDAAISNTTIVNNSALRAGGGFYQGSSATTVTFTSTIIAGNVDQNGGDAFGDDPDLSGFVLTSGGNNIFGVLNTAGGLAAGVNRDQAGTLASPLDPGLDVLGDNGGLTWTHAILPGSPALDNGSNPLGLTTDQRGEARTRGTGTDVGAFEFVPRPDLLATAFNAASDNLPNSETDVTFTVMNAGGGHAESFDTHVVWSPNNLIGDEDDRIVSGSRVSFSLGIPGLGSVTRTIRLHLSKSDLYAHAVATTPAGDPVGTVSLNTSHLFLVVDIDNNVVESNEANNSSQGHMIDSDDVSWLPWDRDGNGTVTPLDALNSIHVVNTADAATDFDGNGVVTPLEALSVLQRIGYVRNGDVGEDPLELNFEISETRPPNGILAIGTSIAVAFAISGEDDNDLFGHRNAPASSPESLPVLLDDDFSATDEDFANGADWLGVV